MYAQEVAVGFAEPCHRTRQQRANAGVIHQIRAKDDVKQGIFTVVAAGGGGGGATSATSVFCCALATAIVAAVLLLVAVVERPSVAVGPVQALHAGVAGYRRGQQSDVVPCVGNLAGIQANR